MTQRLFLLGAVVVLGSIAAVVLLDPILAAFAVIMLVTALGAVLAARNWDQHSTYEQREHARALRRKEKWERNKDARERDRERWQAHQARKAAERGDR